MKYIICISTVMIMMTGCSLGLSLGHDRMVKLGNSSNTQAEFDGLRSVITETKHTGDKPSSAWQFREKQEAEITKRASGSIFDSIFTNENTQEQSGS